MDSSNKLSVYGAIKTRKVSTHGRSLVNELIKGRKEASQDTIRECLEKDGQYAPLVRYKVSENKRGFHIDSDEYNHHDSNALHLLLGLDHPKSFIVSVLSSILELCPSAASVQNAKGNFHT